MTSFQLNDRVAYSETLRGAGRVMKFGNVVEIGAGDNEGRIRVRWDFWLYESGYKKQDGKRTWVKSSRLLPSSILS